MVDLRMYTKQPTPKQIELPLLMTAAPCPYTSAYTVVQISLTGTRILYQFPPTFQFPFPMPSLSAGLVSHLRFHILYRGHACIALEGFTEITDRMKAISFCNLFHGKICRSEIFCCVFNAAFVPVFHRCGR